MMRKKNTKTLGAKVFNILIAARDKCASLKIARETRGRFEDDR